MVTVILLAESPILLTQMVTVPSSSFTLKSSSVNLTDTSGNNKESYTAMWNTILSGPSNCTLTKPCINKAGYTSYYNFIIDLNSS